MFPIAVERWRPHILRYVPIPAGGVDYWLAWIKKESGGNLCSYTLLRESGLFQLMPPDNTGKGGTSEAALRPACSGQTVTRAYSEAEIREQMVSFSRYLAYITERATEKLAAVGVPWQGDQSFWSFVKLQHAYPSPTQAWLEIATRNLGHPPRDWAEFRRALPVTGDLMGRVLANAEEVGFYGRGSTLILMAALAGGLGLVYYLWKSRRRR